jgi:hypothetical protein
MKNKQNVIRGVRYYIIGLVSMLLAVCAMVISVKNLFPENPVCKGMLGAGFPVLFICDNWGGGSPTNSWGKITPIDVINGGITLGGFLVDFLFYTVLFYGAILLMLTIYQRIIIGRKRK